MINRIDRIEIDDNTQEVWVKDDFNIYIMYECCLTDMQSLENDLLRIGSYYISKLEELYDSEVDKVMHKKDRQQVLIDLLNCELDFQFKKVKLTELYMQCYEHICDPLEQQQLIQIIVDTMGRRPRLSLESLYFRDSYRAEVNCLNKQIELLETVIYDQMEREKQENSWLHESLNLSYTLAQRKNRAGWKYQDADQLLQQIKKKLPLNTTSTEEKEPESLSGEDEVEQDNQDSKKKQLTYEDPDFEMRNMRYTDQELDPDAFTKLLGLPKITLEQLFKLCNENDDMVLDIMAEKSHFTALLEGYPDVMSHKHSGNRITVTNDTNHADESPRAAEPRTTGGSRSDAAISRHPSRPELMKILDFYSDSMGFVLKMTSGLKSCMSELQQVLKPHDNVQESCLEASVLEAALNLYRQTKNMLDGTLTESAGHEYIEDDSVMGSSDKMVFYIKDMVAELSHCKKQSQNPFIVGKLSLATLKGFKFPVGLRADQNPYIIRQNPSNMDLGTPAGLIVS